MVPCACLRASSLFPGLCAVSLSTALRREGRLLGRDRAFAVWVLLTFVLAAAAVLEGLGEVADQRATLARLVELDRLDRDDAQQKHPEWGGTAYYSFHLTFNAPSELAFAALGLRDQEPWIHRIRMLALEGQIYERDAGNPVLALTGRFDFAFFAAFVLPLVLIGVLHDLHAQERRAGRHALLVATAGQDGVPWRLRAALRTGVVMLAALIPLVGGALWEQATFEGAAAACVAVMLYGLFWGTLTYIFASVKQGAPVILAGLLGLWACLAVVLPASLKAGIDEAIPVPEGADILLVQREAVNAAWDLPKAATMEPFLERHPEWAPYGAVDAPFAWKWFFAFQQVGDQKAEALSQAYRRGRIARDNRAASLAWLAPPALLERTLESLAGTDLRAHFAYEDQIRAFHAQLRAFYYPKFFKDEPYDRGALQGLPRFEPPKAR